MISKVDDFFDFAPTTVEHLGTVYEGYQISLKDEYRYLLKGKITLPKEVSIGGAAAKPVLVLGNFSPKKISDASSSNMYITDVYFAGVSENSYFELEQYCFGNPGPGSNYTAYKKIYLPDTVVKVGSHSFYYCKELEFVQLNNNIEYIESAAFEQCTKLKSLGLDELPANLISCGTSAFNQTPGLYATYLPDNFNGVF